jgi:hypothetical protein
MTTVLNCASLDGTDDGGSDNAVTLRLVISAAALAAATGNKFQVTYRSGNASGSNSPAISGAWIGQAASAGSLNFNGNQVQIKFAGANTANITAANQTITSDIGTFGETFDNTKDYIIATRFDSGATLIHTTAGAFTNVNSQFLIGTAAGEEALTTASPGYTSQPNTGQVVRQIFVTAAGGAGNLALMGVG